MDKPTKQLQTPAKFALVGLYVLVISSPLLVAVLAVPQTDHSLLSEVAKNCGLVGIGVLLVQFVLAARLPLTNRFFGLDSVMIFHRVMGIFALVLLLAHPVLLAIGESNWKLLYAIDLPWHIWAGKTTLLLLLIHVLVSVFRRTLRLSFERWRILHDTLAIGIISLALSHSWYSGGDFSALPMRVLWGILGSAAVLAFLWHRLIRPRRLAAHPYRVSEVRQESADVWTVRLELPAGCSTTHLPGQFHFLTFPNSKGVPAEEHHFTISSSPIANGFVESTIKACGDFTRLVGEIQPGDSAIVHGNFGRFTYVHNDRESDLVFIAGGIGITPLISMLRHLRDTDSQRSVTLIYGNRTESDILFRSELDEMQSVQRPPLRVVYVLSKPGESWAGENGHVDGKILNRSLSKNLDVTDFFLCGPADMTKQVVSALRHQNVPQRNLHTESFSLIRDTAPTSSRSAWRKRATFLTVFVSLILIAAIAVMRAGGSGDTGDGHEHSHSHVVDQSENGSPESSHNDSAHSHGDE